MKVPNTPRQRESVWAKSKGVNIDFRGKDPPSPLERGLAEVKNLLLKQPKIVAGELRQIFDYLSREEVIEFIKPLIQE